MEIEIEVEWWIRTSSRRMLANEQPWIGLVSTVLSYVLIIVNTLSPIMHYAYQLT